MKRILSLFVVLFFVAGCGEGSGDDIRNSPDFEEIEVPTEFTPDDYVSEHEKELLRDRHLIPVEIIELFKDALTKEVSRKKLIDKIRGSSLCSLDDKTDEELWDEAVYQFSLDELEEFGRNLDEAIRNSLANDLNLILDEEDEIEFYGETLEIDEVWSIVAAEVNGLDPGSDHEDFPPQLLLSLGLCSDYLVR